MSLLFTQSCPTCGRRMRVRASLMGMSVACQHCNATFTADGANPPSDGFLSASNDTSNDTSADASATASFGDIDAADPLMARVERALKMATDQSPIA